MTLRRPRVPGLRRAGLALALLAAAASPSTADAPRSAIPWLSQSLEAPPPAAEGPGSDPSPAEPPAAEAPPPDQPDSPGEITVTPLPAIALDAVGLLPPAESGLARDLWGGATAFRVRNLVLNHRDAGVPEARALFRRILLAEADPPAGGDGTGLLVARIDRLLAMGALEEADALATRAGAETPELFRRMFDIGLLLDRAEPACEALRRNPALSPTLPARIFCLARDGDWNAAEITLTLGRNVGSLSPEEEAALARFLDPELFEHLPTPPPPEPFTPLDFLLREAVGLPRPPGALPLAFLHQDLAPWMPMRTRIEAGERLAAEGILPGASLFDAYRAGRPAASGGIWDRAAAVHALDAALQDGDPTSVAGSLFDAKAAFAARGLLLPLAEDYADALAELDPAPLDEAAREALARMLLLAGRTEAAAAAAPTAPAPALRLRLAIARGEPADRDEADAQERTAIDGLTAERAPDERAARLAALAEEGRQGEAILGALALLADGSRTDPASLASALFVLRRAGQDEAARRIALQTLILAEADPA